MADQKTVLVFGGVGGIGEALSRHLTNDGHRVFLTSRSSKRATTLANEIGAHALVADANKPETLSTAVAQASEDGVLHGLAYCIGSIVLKPLRAVTAVDMAESFHLNTVGAALAVQAAATPLKQGNGSVVLFSSVAAQKGFPHHVAIAPAKAAIDGLTVSLAAELAPHVRVNAIAPSLTDTPLAANMLKNTKMAEALAAQHPLGRLGTPDDHAALAALLLAGTSGWITGQIFGVDGGRSCLGTARG